MKLQGCMGKYYKWFLLLLLSGAFFFHQADRALFGLLTLPIQNELGLDGVQIGWINTVLFWTLAAMAFVAGPVGDCFSRKWVITISLMAWSVMTVMMGFVGEWHVLGFVLPAFVVVMFFRSIATGIGESFYGPCYPPLIASYHKETLSVALSIHQGSLYFGLMTSGLIVAKTLGLLGDWRNVFIAFGAAGFVLGLSFIFLLKDGSNREPRTTNHEPRTSLFSGYKAFFTNPSAILAMCGFIAIVFVNNAYLCWAPKFMAVKFMADMPMKEAVAQAGSATMLWHHLFAFAAIMAGAVVTDRFVKRFPRFRLGFQITALLLGAPCLAIVGFSSSATMMIVMSALYGVFRGFFEVNTHASLFDVMDPRFRSTSVGIFTLFAFSFGGLSGVLMGWLSDEYGVRGFEVGFGIMGVTYVIGAVLMMISFFFTFKKDSAKLKDLV